MLANQTNYKTPYVYWGQNEECLYVTIKIDSPNDVDLHFEKHQLNLECSSVNNVSYKINMNLYGEIDFENSSYVIKSQKIDCVLKKSENGLWSMLTKNNQHKQFIKIDWDKWTELNKEDDPTAESEIDMESMHRMMQSMGGGMPGLEGGMPGMPGMEGMPGMPGMPGMEGGMPDMDYEQFMKEGNMEKDADSENETKIESSSGDNTENDVIQIDTSI
jgi:hypothetical protein